ncbi:23S rRNA (guanosine(2251)-2'-O)-methyltransferase RlmB [Erysipelothrix sp. HDW6A]|uniref:23S rRNA (guanosine(2251)-2'-O)-methyltransferase RlmB n=1 Tax=Erysipelothrix sp. HDW6A TaxID=2714928 RepID=UPI0014094A04|nr:23S rRNA (guanosine(2251)-2'-O)-methyltransferase RlmB [Erysipelothrix sp. HDW6A]QIK56418.1 23S rRNA (guanosine(2251)-2'-O)-methyltransferase RlmB [Erysipelothrix sp. HDW6A]
MSKYIFGKNTVVSFLKTGKRPQRVYLFDKGNYPEIVQLAKSQNVELSFVAKHRLDKMVDGVHQGVVAEVEDYKYMELDVLIKNAKNKLIVMCDQLEDPHNLGAILRTADATGVDGVIIGKHRSVSLTDTVAKVSTGAINTVPVVQATNMVQALKELKAAGYWVVAAENGVKAVEYTEFPVDMPLVLVVGSEGKGVSRIVKEECDILTTIPMAGSVNSLNVSVATAVVLFDIIRRRKEK